MKFKRQIDFTAAYDRTDPDPAKNYGRHGVDALFTLIGDHGAVRFKLMTAWESNVLEARAPFPAQIELHSRASWQDAEFVDDCDLLGGDCWYKCFYNLADEAYDALTGGGDAGLWAWLEDLYNETWGNMS